MTTSKLARTIEANHGTLQKARNQLRLLVERALIRSGKFTSKKDFMLFLKGPRHRKPSKLDNKTTWFF